LSKSIELSFSEQGITVTDKEYEKERRRQARLERLGSDNPKCLFCDEDEPSCLERHHIGGMAFGDECVIVCRNCHRKLSDKQKDHPPVVAGSPNTLECGGRLLLGVADALELWKVPPVLVDLIRQVGVHLIEYGQAFRPCDEVQP
jgi:hypothetical protein